MGKDFVGEHIVFFAEEAVLRRKAFCMIWSTLKTDALQKIGLVVFIDSSRSPVSKRIAPPG